MRRVLEKKELTGVKVLEGEASNMSGVESHSVHAVIAAQVRPLIATTSLKWASYADIRGYLQAFHWYSRQDFPCWFVKPCS